LRYNVEIDMNYDFTLDRKGMISVLASTFLMGGLLFVAGLIIGSYWTANMSTASAASRQRASAADLNSLPQEPVRMNELPQATLVVPNKPSVGLNGETTGPAALTMPQTPQSIAQPKSGSETQSAAPEQGADNQAANTSAEGAEKQPAKAESASAAAQNVDQSNLVTVEVGTFLDANAANHLFKNMERKGYAPTFFTGRDAQAREWYSIRIGAYADKQQAENAAANFAKQEKIKAVVRPLGSL
jgi:cell division septation protein DedD